MITLFQMNNKKVKELQEKTEKTIYRFEERDWSKEWVGCYDMVAIIETNDLDKAYEASNLRNEGVSGISTYTEKFCNDQGEKRRGHSMRINDICFSSDEVAFYRVAGIGFEKLNDREIKQTLINRMIEQQHYKGRV